LGYEVKLDGQRLCFTVTDATWLFLDRIGILLGLVTPVVTLSALFIGYFNRERLRRWLTRNRFPAVGGTLAEHIRYDGLVFTVSKPETPAWVLDQIKPRAAVFVASDQSRGVADELKARAAGLAGPFVVSVGNPDDPGETRLAVRQAIERLSIIGCANIAVDVTGGKVPMSLGAFMAAEEMGRDSLYVSVDYDARLNKPDMRTARIIVMSRPADAALTLAPRAAR
jgi:hypothetical protein